jgi:hypothetical protein
MPATTAHPARKKKGKWTEIDAAAKEVKAAKVAKPKASATKKAEAKKPARGRKPEVPTTPLASAIQAKNEKLVKAGETPISQTALGNAVGVSKFVLNRWARGVRQIPEAFLKPLAEVLGTSVKKLAGGA